MLTQGQIEEVRNFLDIWTANGDDAVEMYVSTVVSLLDMAETLLALEWANNDPHLTCKTCPMSNGCTQKADETWCGMLLFDHAAEWLAAFREHKKEGIDYASRKLERV